MQPQRWQPTRLPRPWDSPGKNTRVGCHFLLQCMKVKSESEVAQSCPTLSDPMDCSLLGSSIHGIFQARVLEWGAIGRTKMISWTNKINSYDFICLIFFLPEHFFGFSKLWQKGFRYIFQNWWWTEMSVTWWRIQVKLNNINWKPWLMIWDNNDQDAKGAKGLCTWSDER